MKKKKKRQRKKRKRKCRVNNLLLELEEKFYQISSLCELKN